MTARLKESFKRAWIDDLRQHPELQGQDRLTTVDSEGNERDCCLGRACKILGVPELDRYRLPNGGLAIVYGTADEDEESPAHHSSESELPLLALKGAIDSAEVPERVAVEFTNLPIFDKEADDGRNLCLEVLNDSDFTFPQIADVIEYFYPVKEGE